MKELYDSARGVVSDDDIGAALRNVGIVSGDLIFVHSDISAFGKISVTGREELLGALVRVLEESVGERGTLVMPTFSYSFCRNEPFNRLVTRSTVGALTDFFRTQQNVVRNVHPLFSVAAWGSHKDDFLDIGKDSFGERTVFETLRSLDGKIVFFGVPLARSCTFSHHLEQMAGVPYRFLKTFTGTIIDGGDRYEDSYTYFVRPLDGTVTLHLDPLETHVRASGLLREARVGSGTIGCVSARMLYDEGMRLLAEDPYYLVEKAPRR